MSLSLQAVDRLFDRLTATYGRQFTGLYEGLEANAVKASWAHELSGYARNLEPIAWALEHLPERAPNAIQFRNLCRQAPEPEVERLPMPDADPARVRAELAKLAPVIEAARKATDNPNLDWARAIVGRYESGERIAACTLKFARQALQRRGVAA